MEVIYDYDGIYTKEGNVPLEELLEHPYHVISTDGLEAVIFVGFQAGTCGEHDISSELDAPSDWPMILEFEVPSRSCGSCAATRILIYDTKIRLPKPKYVSSGV